MKKSLLFIAAACIAGSSFAQTEGAAGITSKKGEVYIPEAGDYAISFDAQPFLNYFGNFIGGDGLNAAPTADFAFGDQGIVGKYFVDANTAYRAKVRLGFGSTSATNLVTDMEDENGEDKVEDKRTIGFTGVQLGGGIEFRRGSTRLQGYYGGEATIGFTSQTTSFEYGNDFGDLDPEDAPVIEYTDWTFGAPMVSTGNTTSGGARQTEAKTGATFSFGVRGFVGAEYFIAPKFSLGVEYGWGLGIARTGSGSATTEVATIELDDMGQFDDVEITTPSADTGSAGAFGLDTDNRGGAIFLNFHF